MGWPDGRKCVHFVTRDIAITFTSFIIRSIIIISSLLHSRRAYACALFYLSPKLLGVHCWNRYKIFPKWSISPSSPSPWPTSTLLPPYHHHHHHHHHHHLDWPLSACTLLRETLPDEIWDESSNWNGHFGSSRGGSRMSPTSHKECHQNYCTGIRSGQAPALLSWQNL